MLRFLILSVIFFSSCSNMLDDFDNGYGAPPDDSLHGYFTINNNASMSYVYKARLNINVHNVVRMRFSNDNTTWSPLELYANTKEDWALALGNGTHRVYGEFQNEKGDVLTLSDDIYVQERITASAPYGMEDDEFGSSVAVSADGLTVVVGTPNDDRDRDFNTPDGLTDDQGAVYVYTWEDNEWKEDKIKAGTLGFAGDNFGCTVAVSGNGNRIIAGGCNAHKVDEGPVFGAAYIFDKAGGVWSETTVYWGDAVDDEFGYSVSISSDGSKIAVGAPNAGSEHGGRIYTGGLSGLVSLTPGSIASGDRFGQSIALSADGNIVAAGAPTKFVSIYNEGIVYLYNGSSWSDFTLGMDAIGGDYYGYSVSLNNDGTICAIGSRGHEINGNVRQGSAYLYSLSGTWSLVNEINFSAGEADDYFGNAVSLNSSGTTVVVGAEQDTRSYAKQGSAFVFSLDGGNYALEMNGELFNPEGQLDDRFGYSTSAAINGPVSIIAVGSYKASAAVQHQGAVYIFRNL
jgi:hypothetical protein